MRYLEKTLSLAQGSLRVKNAVSNFQSETTVPPPVSKLPSAMRACPTRVIAMALVKKGR